MEEAYEYIEDMKEREKKIYEKTGEEYGIIDKCFAPPWIPEDCNVQVIELIKRIELLQP